MHLHRGPIKKLGSKRQYDREHKVIRLWKKKIETLLQYHIISMLDKQTFVLFVLRNKENNHQVQCVVVKSDALVTLLSSP
jgi:hypothetical protein